eukprot:TRINITY_DN72539_c0_g1_i1.p1 TRINITY_DN72539_c0_g1~~TRINITY_DN72539_c0_g1_i1.p1  ORF type:complete len:327 (-),score=68.02 TRINITY_DN72539_c0_g1_i1:116-979(-)
MFAAAASRGPATPQGQETTRSGAGSAAQSAAGDSQEFTFPLPSQAASAVADAASEVSEQMAAMQASWEPRLGQAWCKAMGVELLRPSVGQIYEAAEQARSSGSVVYPPRESIFRAFLETSLEKVRVVIVGQDPYHGRGQAMGLAFSVPRGISVPPSLQNMLKEAGAWPSRHGDLTSWTQQGVFLLNTLLTVLEGLPLSHKTLGWERFTDAAIRAVSKQRKDVIFLLWGKEAQAKAKLVDTSRRKVLTAGHPSPLSYEKHFKGCGHFRKVNELLAARGEQEISWQLPP